MSEVYNPETRLQEELEALTAEAAKLRRERGEAKTDAEAQVIDQQLHQVEHRIETLQRKLRG